MANTDGWMMIEDVLKVGVFSEKHIESIHTEKEPRENIPTLLNNDSYDVILWT